MTQTGRIIDPHTAVAVAAPRKLGCPAGPVVILSTAHPAKFPDAVSQRHRPAPPVPPPPWHGVWRTCRKSWKSCPTSFL